MGIKQLELAASNGNASAMYHLAIHYWEGNVLGRDIDKATDLLTRSAYRGNRKARDFLARAYRMGNVIPRDLEKADAIMKLPIENYESYRYVPDVDVSSTPPKRLTGSSFLEMLIESTEKDKNQAS